MRSSSAFEFEQLTPPPVAVSDRATLLAEAEATLERARAEAEAIREQARREGFQAGYEAGRAAASEELRPSVEALRAAHAELGELRNRAADAVEAHAVHLALRLAEKVLGAALQARPEHVVDVVRGSLRRLIERDRVQVLVHPDDLDILRAAADGLRSELGGIGALEVQAERRVARGGAIVRTAEGEIDGRLETQLARARETLLAALAGPAPGADGTAPATAPADGPGAGAATPTGGAGA
jgi:flagellar assembly protein FliH